MESALHPFLTATGWALLHFLWQGAVLSLAARGLMTLARDRAPETRYRIACAVLGLMVAAFLGTLAWNWDRDAVTAAAGTVVQVSLAEASEASSLLAQAHHLLEANLLWIVAAWFAGSLVMLARLGAALSWTYGQLRHTTPAPAAWEARLERLRRAGGSSRGIRLLGSPHVDSPMVMGWLKPVILMPAAAFAAMSPEAVEALLAHELAHVLRGDFLANLVQNLAEVLFFYHPAVWWLSRQIRQER